MQEAELNIKTNLPATIAELRNLKQELKTVDADSDRFRTLTADINDMQDAIKASKTGADNFAEVLGTLPGPIGQIGSQIGGTIQSLKQFGAIKFTNLKASFVDLGKDLIDAGKGLANLTGLTKVYTVTNNALAKSFFGVAAGETAAATAAGVLTAALAATGITLIIGAIGLLVEAYKDWAGAAEKAAEAQKVLNERAQKGVEAATNASIAFNKSEEDIAVKRAQLAGASENEIQKIRETAAKDRIRIAKENLAKLQKVQNADTTAAADAVAIAEDDLTKLQLDGQIARRKQSIANAKQTAADKEKLRKEEEQKEKDRNAKSVKDTEEFEKNLSNRLLELFNENKAKLTLAKEQGLIDEQEYQDKLLALSLTNAENETDRINAQIVYTQFLNQQKEERLKIDKEEKDKAAENAKLYAEQQIAYNKAVRESWQELGSGIANSFVQIANLFEKGSDAAKVFAIASVLINAAVSISKINDTFASEISDAKKSISAGITAVATGTAISPVNPVQGSLLIAAGTKAKLVGGSQLALAKANKGLQIAAVGASAAAQVAAITSAGKSKSASVSSGGGSAGGSAPSFGGIPSTPTPQIQSGEGINPSTQIAQTIGAAQKPIQAYVVSTQISSQQALDRRTNAAATFS